ncbi:Tripeptidyl-peptidase sed1 [Cladobotryum mycophilum]|uniref:tripeptidyl-peptidase II n=1 Tax=Cladobotryum mycophilum TaxID=491253 RepID=A0ABR0SU13_9HYPO
MKISLILLNGLLAGAIAVPTSSGVVHEKRDTSNGQWIKREALDASTKVPVRIALKQKNLDKGFDYLLEVSDPASKKYGKHYTADEVVQLFAPSDDSVSAVKAWLVKFGIPVDKITSPKSKGWLDFETTSGQLESLLNANYHVYDHRDFPLVDFITPGVVFAQTTQPSKLKKRDGVAISESFKEVPAELAQFLAANPESTENCGAGLTPACIKKMYNITDGTLANPSNKLGIFEISGDRVRGTDIYSQIDLDSFYSQYARNIPAGTGPKVNAIDGATAPTTPSNAGIESDLDFEMAIPIIYPQKTELFQTYTNGHGIFNRFLDAVDGAYCTSSAYGETGDDPGVDGRINNEQCGTFKPSNVISFSYGAAEADYPTYYLQRQCDEFMKLGLQGTSIVFASGDDGVARRSGPCLGPNENIFTPGTGASCPYVTTVGATTLPKGSQVGDAETATTSRFSSGGGFSNIWTTPSYQASAVASYFSKHNPGYPSYSTSGGKIPASGGIYNKAGRGYPDLSAVGENGVIIAQGRLLYGGGTSMAAPIVASIFTRINDERLRAGKSIIGFANPALYKNPSMFNDVTVGNQDKGAPVHDWLPSACGNTGFSAVPGWDPVTGLGTPNYAAMLEYFMSI